MTVRNASKALTSVVLSELECKRRLDDSTVLLVGSVARGTQTASSDVDILLIEPRRRARVRVDPKIQLFPMTRKQFLDRLEAGDDFPHWVVRFGKVLSDRPDWWTNVIHNPATQLWPNWRRKFKQASARLSLASRLRSLGDYEHSQEEYLLAARHLARGVLLQRNVFPLSQPELPGQLREIGCARLADTLDELAGQPSKKALLMRAHRRLAGWSSEPLDGAAGSLAVASGRE